MNLIIDDLLRLIGIKRGMPDCPPSTRVHVDMPPCQPCKMEAPLPWPDPPLESTAPLSESVSCLALGIVKSIESGEVWDHGMSISYCKGSRVHQGSGMTIIYPIHDCMSFTSKSVAYPDWFKDVPHSTSTDHVFNPREARLIEDAFIAQLKRDVEAYKRERDLKNAAANQRFIDLGCPSSTAS